LVDTLVEDFSSSGRIRAAELQLIAAELKRQGVTLSSGYKSLGSAKGILSSYIKDEIKRSPHPSITPYVLARCARLVKPRNRKSI
jgi:hypothetical protein